MPNRLKLALAAAVVLVFFVSAQGTAALWRAEGELAPGTVTTGRLSLAAGNGVSSAQDYVFTELQTSSLTPGGFVQAPLTINNTGTVALRYSLAGAKSSTPAPGAADTALGSSVVLSMQHVPQRADCTASTPNNGALVNQRKLDQASFAQTRGLAAGSSETLCVRVSLPGAAPQTASGGTLLLVLSFRGEQA
ncbi:hypothetical protein ACFUCV_01235 [Specibacter sp. NPDC057265]|uniref:hypothetical protein n=1 Tax=Specibacter sp. NPDC057265 TaxID=3346075 RepID=UPI003636AED9